MQGNKELSADKVAEIKKEFEFFDNDKNGEIDVQEFWELLKILSPNASEAQANEGFSIIDENGDGHIDFEEFLSWWQDNWWEY